MSPDSRNFLDTSEGEVSLFRSIMRTRPVGIHRHVHVLAIHNSIYRDTGFKVPMKDIWEKLNRMYDLEALELAVSLLSWFSPANPDSCAGFSMWSLRNIAAAGVFIPGLPSHANTHTCRSSTARILTQTPIPHLLRKTSKYTQASKKNLIH